jgi:hypothetical protein
MSILSLIHKYLVLDVFLNSQPLLFRGHHLSRQSANNRYFENSIITIPTTRASCHMYRQCSHCSISHVCAIASGT